MMRKLTFLLLSLSASCSPAEAIKVRTTETEAAALKAAWLDMAEKYDGYLSARRRYTGFKQHAINAVPVQGRRPGYFAPWCVEAIDVNFRDITSRQNCEWNMPVDGGAPPDLTVPRLSEVPPWRRSGVHLLNAQLSGQLWSLVPVDVFCQYFMNQRDTGDTILVLRNGQMLTPRMLDESSMRYKILADQTENLHQRRALALILWAPAKSVALGVLPEPVSHRDRPAPRDGPAKPPR